MMAIVIAVRKRASDTTKRACQHNHPMPYHVCRSPAVPGT
jgi:hypothetical protein